MHLLHIRADLRAMPSHNPLECRLADVLGKKCQRAVQGHLG